MYIMSWHICVYMRCMLMSQSESYWRSILQPCTPYSRTHSRSGALGVRKSACTARSRTRPGTVTRIAPSLRLIRRVSLSQVHIEIFPIHTHTHTAAVLNYKFSAPLSPRKSIRSPRIITSNARLRCRDIVSQNYRCNYVNSSAALN